MDSEKERAKEEGVTHVQITSVIVKQINVAINRLTSNKYSGEWVKRKARINWTLNLPPFSNSTMCSLTSRPRNVSVRKDTASLSRASSGDMACSSTVREHRAMQ